MNHTILEHTALDDDKSNLVKGIAGQNMTALPKDFTPGEWDVICGRGRKAFNHVGNERFRKLVEDRLEEYSSASAKLEKSYILSDIVCEVRQRSPSGGFVKRDSTSGRWYEVGDFLAREKTSQAFRDALHDQYKSSNTAKKKRRQAEQQDKLFHDHGSTSSFHGSAGSLLHSSASSLLHSSAGSLVHTSTSSAHHSSGSLLHSSTSSLHHNSASSLQFDANNSYTFGKQPMMPLRSYEGPQDSLLGALDVELSHGFGGGGLKANMTVGGQHSARSVVDFSSQLQQQQQQQQQLQQQQQQQNTQAFFNNSCPNLGGWSFEADRLGYDKLNRSAPDMFADLDFGMPPSPPRSMHGRALRRTSSSDSSMMEVDESESFGDDLILSPIGDGSPQKLFNSLTNPNARQVNLLRGAPMLE